MARPGVDYICCICAEELGATYPGDRMSTWFRGNCGICKKDAATTHVRNFNWPEPKGRTVLGVRMPDESTVEKCQDDGDHMYPNSLFPASDDDGC